MACTRDTVTFTRRNIYDLGGDWADPILWYARGVAALKKRAVADPTSWRFYAAIHGMYVPLWRAYGYLTSTDQMPPQPEVDRYWQQCQHGSWYFLPWHRGYLLAFEAAVRAAVVSLGGPKDWALPYWNYFKPRQNALPPAFASPDWPDGTGDNPLFVPQRYGPNNDGDVHIPLNEVNLDAMRDPDFTGVASGGDPGFGGVDTGFEHGGPVHGRLESQPHDWVHVLVGGANPADQRFPGLMSDPDTAGLDPIFWLHHANIDRLWEVWQRDPNSNGNPTESKWVDGPASIGERVFVMPMPPNGAPWEYTPGQMGDLAALDYTYDDLSPVTARAIVEERVRGLREARAVVPESVGMVKNVELVGANAQPLRISGRDPIRASVQIDEEARRRMADRVTLESTNAEPDRVFLNLENVRGLADATAFQVYVNVPEGANPADHPERLAGNVGLFGVRKATQVDEEHAGQGLTFVLEITPIVDTLQLSRSDLDGLDVRIVPVRPVAEEAEISIGRISVFRQGS